MTARHRRPGGKEGREAQAGRLRRQRRSARGPETAPGPAALGRQPPAPRSLRHGPADREPRRRPGCPAAALTSGEQDGHGAQLQLQPDEDVAGMAIHLHGAARHSPQRRHGRAAVAHPCPPERRRAARPRAEPWCGHRCCGAGPGGRPRLSALPLQLRRGCGSGTRSGGALAVPGGRCLTDTAESAPAP